MNITIVKEMPLSLRYDDIKFNVGYRVDLMVDEKVIIEIKAVEAIIDVHIAQLLTYLKISKCKLGILINFNVALLKNGFKRIVNNL